MLTRYDEAERAAWWEEMEQIRNSKDAEVQGRRLGDKSNEEEVKLAGYMWVNFLCAEELMAQEEVPAQSYLAAYASWESWGMDDTTNENEEEGDEDEEGACGDWRYDDEQQDWTWQDKREDNWQQVPVPDDDDKEGQEDEYGPAYGAPERGQGGEQECWFVEDPEEQTKEHEEEVIGAESGKEEDKVEEEPWKDSAEQGGAEKVDASYALTPPRKAKKILFPNMLHRVSEKASHSRPRLLMCVKHISMGCRLGISV